MASGLTIMVNKSYGNGWKIRAAPKRAGVDPCPTRLGDERRPEIWSMPLGRQLELVPHKVERHILEMAREQPADQQPIGSPTKDVFARSPSDHLDRHSFVPGPCRSATSRTS